MGTLGRDAVFWLFLVSAFTSLFWAGVIPVVGSVVFALLFFYHFLVERRQAIKKSRAKGLETVALVPLSPLIAWLYLLLAGGKKIARQKRAYEIHVPGYTGGAALERDLKLIYETFPRPAVYFWETSVPLPASVRQLIREMERSGRAYWVKGAFPVPKVFGKGYSRREKEHVRRGVMVLD